jgi:hypothetical protein
MVIILIVAGITASRGAFKNAIDMTTQAGGRDVSTCQLVSGEIVVEGGWQPRRSGMTAAAIGTETTIMSIILFVAGITVAGCIFEYIVDMATLACCVGVFSCQFEGRQVVVVAGRFPTRC